VKVEPRSLVKKSGELEKASVHGHAVVDEDKYRADGHVERIVPEPGVFVPRGQLGMGKITIHDRRRQRSRWKGCKQTFSAHRGTMCEDLRKPVELIVIVVTLLTYGCPVQAIVHAFDLDKRTVADWRDRAGRHCQPVHQQMGEQGKLDLMHVQADEIRGKAGRWSHGWAWP